MSNPAPNPHQRKPGWSPTSLSLLPGSSIPWRTSSFAPGRLLNAPLRRGSLSNSTASCSAAPPICSPAILDPPERVHLRQAAKRLAVDGRPVPGHAEQSEDRAETEADRIRRFAAETIIEPARREGGTSISIRAGDVAASMELRHNTPKAMLSP